MQAITKEFNYSEIGEVLGVTESRVCQLHARAIARLRVEMEPALDDEPEARAEPPRLPARKARR